MSRRHPLRPLGSYVTYYRDFEAPNERAGWYIVTSWKAEIGPYLTAWMALDDVFSRNLARDEAHPTYRP